MSDSKCVEVVPESDHERLVDARTRAQGAQCSTGGEKTLVGLSKVVGRRRRVSFSKDSLATSNRKRAVLSKFNYKHHDGSPVQRSFTLKAQRAMSSAMKGGFLLSKMFFRSSPDKAFEELLKKLCSVEHHGVQDGEGEDPYSVLLRDDIISIEDDVVVPDYIISCVTNSWAAVIASTSLLCVGITAITAPFTFVWNASLRALNKVPFGFGVSLIVVDALMDAIYLACKLLGLRVSVINKTKWVEVVRPKNIWRHHIKNPVYILQVSSTLPYLIAFCFPDVTFLINAIKCVRLVDLAKTPDAFWLTRTSSDSVVAYCLKLVLVIYIASHWLGCFLACVGGYRAELEKIAANSSDYVVDSRVSVELYMYASACTEALHMWFGQLQDPTGLGDDSVRKDNVYALALAASFGVIGFLAMSFLSASVCRNYLLNHAITTKSEQKRAYLSRALASLDIPLSIRERVYRFYDFRTQHHDSVALAALFDPGTLSGPLDCALRAYLYTSTVLSSPFFKGRSDQYILEVVRVLEDEVFIPGDYLIRFGELASEMFFVGKGRLSVLIPRKGSVEVTKSIHVSDLSVGHYFGEVALIRASLRTAWVRADTYVVTPVLARKKIEPIWKFFPAERDLLTQRVTRVLQCDEIKRHACQRVRQKVLKASEVVRLRNSRRESGDSLVGLAKDATSKLKLILQSNAEETSAGSLQQKQRPDPSGSLQVPLVERKDTE